MLAWAEEADRRIAAGRLPPFGTCPTPSGTATTKTDTAGATGAEQRQRLLEGGSLLSRQEQAQVCSPAVAVFRSSGRWAGIRLPARRGPGMPRVHASVARRVRFWFAVLSRFEIIMCTRHSCRGSMEEDRSLGGGLLAGPNACAQGHVTWNHSCLRAQEGRVGMFVLYTVLFRGKENNSPAHVLGLYSVWPSEQAAAGGRLCPFRPRGGFSQASMCFSLFHDNTCLVWPVVWPCQP